MPVGSVALPSLDCSQAQPTHVMTSTLLGLTHSQPQAFMFSGSSYGLPREFPKFSYQAGSQTWFSHVPAGALALFGTVCLQSWLSMCQWVLQSVQLASSQSQLL